MDKIIFRLVFLWLVLLLAGCVEEPVPTESADEPARHDEPSEPARSDGPQFCDVGDWGPQGTIAGEGFNEQPDGSSALWIMIECVPPETVVTFDNVELPTTIRPDEGIVTIVVDDSDLYAEPGRYEVVLLDKASGRSEPVGDFLVTE